MKKIIFISILALYNINCYSDTTSFIAPHDTVLYPVETISTEPPIAHNKDEELYRLNMWNLAKVLRYTGQAYTCTFRSEFFYKNMTTGLLYLRNNQHQTLMASSPTSKQYLWDVEDWLSKYSAPYAPTQKECKSLYESGDLQMIDRIYYKITSGYH